MNDVEAANLITVITTTHPISSVPSDEHLYIAQASLCTNAVLANSKKIIVFDGVAPAFKERTSNYELYKQKVISLQRTDPFFTNTELIFCQEWVQLSGAIHRALKKVVTPFIFIHQHDMYFTKSFNISACLESMLINPNIKWIQFSGRPNSAHKGDMQTSRFGPIDEYVEGGSLIPLTRVFGWSDHSHIASLAYYKDFIMPMCKGNYMEDSVCAAFKKALLHKNLDEIHDIHLQFGTYLYGGLQDGCFFCHSNGSLDDLKYLQR